MLALRMHLHAINVLEHSNNKIVRVTLTINGCLLRGVGELVIRSKRGTSTSLRASQPATTV